MIDLRVAERLLDRPRPDFIEVRVDDLFAAREVALDISNRLGSDYQAQDWADQNKSLFQALWLEKMAMAIAIGLIVMVAALNIIASLIMLVMEKTRDIAILKTMGASARSVMMIFIAQGTAIGIVGTALGSIGGLALCWVLDHYKVVHIPIDVYQVSYVPFIVLPEDFVIVVVSAIAICFVSTIYPSRQASRLDPVQALRFE
jgi:lipoprotein-releasing system permease protein